MMDSSEPEVHSFIVKVWLEESTEGDGRVVWRGHVTHVPGSERRYLKELDDIGDFITPYLEAGGVRLKRRGRLQSWLRRLGHWRARRDTCL